MKDGELTLPATNQSADNIQNQKINANIGDKANGDQQLTNIMDLNNGNNQIVGSEIEGVFAIPKTPTDSKRSFAQNRSDSDASSQMEVDDISGEKLTNNDIDSGIENMEVNIDVFIVAWSAQILQMQKPFRIVSLVFRTIATIYQKISATVFFILLFLLKGINFLFEG